MPPSESARAPINAASIEIALCLAVTALTAWAVLTSGWVGGGDGAVVVGVAAVLEAALLARAHTPRLLAVLAAPVLGLLTVVVATVGAMPAVPRQVFGAIASHYVRAVFTGVSSGQPWDFTVGLCAIFFVTGYWLAWVTLHEHRGVIAVVPVYSVLAIDVLNTADPDRLVLPVTLAMGLSLAVIAAAHLGSLDARWGPAHITPLDGVRWRFARSAAPVAAILTIVALVLPAISSTDYSTSLFSQGVGTDASEQGAGGAGPGGTTAIGFNLSVSLGGSLVSQPKPVLTYRTATDSSAYLQIADDTAFDRGNWYAPGRGASVDGGDIWGGVPFLSGPLPRDTNTLDGGVGSDEQALKAEIVVDQGATGDELLVPFTGEPDAVNFPGTAFGPISPTDNYTGLLTIDSVELNSAPGATTTFQTTSLVSTATATELSAAGTHYPGWTTQYTQLNDDGTRGLETIRALAQEWTSGVADPYDQAIAIETHLRDPALFQYTLDPPTAPNPETWPLVYFLTTSHRGYCQYFASAMGAMLRSLNIPTRLITGYGPGTPAAEEDLRARPTIGEQIVTTSDAHTWVEAYFPNYGWIPFEPTPPSSQGDYEPFTRGAAAISHTVVPPSSAPHPSITRHTPPPPPASTPSTRGSLPSVVPLVISILGGLVGLAVLALLWFALPRSVTGVWRRVEALGRLSGLERRNAETHRAFALRLGRSRPSAGPDFTELADLTGRAEFSATGTSMTDRVLALRTWHRVLFATLWWRLRRTSS